MPQLGTVALYLCRVLGAAAFLPHYRTRCIPAAHKNNEDMAAKTMTYHELLHSLTFDDDIIFVPLPGFLIVKCKLKLPIANHQSLITNHYSLITVH